MLTPSLHHCYANDVSGDELAPDLSICKLELDLDRYAKLFNLQYCVDGDVSLKKAIVCIRSIKNVSIHM